MPHTVESDPLDPFEAHFRRDAMTGAAVSAIVLTRDDPARGAVIAAAIKALAARLDRSCEVVVESVHLDGWARALERGLAATSLPLVLIVTAVEPPRVEHLRPLLEAIDHCDHAFGKRPAGVLGSVARRLGGSVWRVIFGAPARDIHVPLRLIVAKNSSRSRSSRARRS